MSTYQWDTMKDVKVMWLAAYEDDKLRGDIALIRYEGRMVYITCKLGQSMTGMAEIPAPKGLTLDELKNYVATLARMEN